MDDEKCAACGMGDGEVADGGDLGPLVTADGSGPVAFVHRGCAPAYDAIRAGAPAPFTASPRRGGLVHVFLDEEGLCTSVCRQHRAPRARVEDAVFVDGHPTCCPACKSDSARGSGRVVAGRLV